jgi:hypothetical protein
VVEETKERDDIESGLPQGVSQDGLEISDVTGEKPRASFLSSCWETLVSSVYTFFSYVSYYLTCCFSKGSFQDVTRNQNENQIRAASILRSFGSKSALLREYGGYYRGIIGFYTEQKIFLLNYLQVLREAVSDLVGTLQDQKEELVKETETDRLIADIIAKLKFLKENTEYEALAIEIENRILNDERLGNNVMRLSANALSSTITLELQIFERKQTVNDALMEKLNVLCNSNQAFLLNSDQDNPTSIANINASSIDAGDPQLLEELSESSLNDLRDRNQRSEKGFKNNMLVLERDIKGYVNSIKVEVGKLHQQRTQVENERAAKAYQKSPFRYSRF